MFSFSELFLVLLCFGVCQTAPSSPHIIFIVADDLGWNDVGFHNPDIISPNIDHLANTGIKLNQSYVQPLCSPSRAAFMTGVYPFRLGLQHSIISETQQVCVPMNRKFLPEALKNKGYATHMVGKWHLGFCSWKCTPTFRGFDTFYGYYGGGETYYSKVVDFNGVGGYDFRNNECVDWTAAGNYSTNQFTDRAVKIIENHDSSKPLFLYFPLQSVHMPLEVPEKYVNMYQNESSTNRKLLSAMVTSMDDGIGRVVQALKDNDLFNDSIIVFTPDNGGWTPYGGNNYPLRGGKISLFEGGTRAAAFIHGKPLNQSGVTYDGMMHAVDWFPTLAEAAGVSQGVPDQDGVSHWSAITTLGQSPRNEFVYNFDFSKRAIQGRAAIRVGDYKLFKGFPGLYNDWYKPEDIKQGINVTFNNTIDSKVLSPFLRRQNMTEYQALFNLRDDPEERHNLYSSRPDIVNQLKARMLSYLHKYVEPQNPDDSDASLPKYWRGAWSPGWCNDVF